jgi:hypothetical protein
MNLRGAIACAPLVFKLRKKKKLEPWSIETAFRLDRR